MSQSELTLQKCWTWYHNVAKTNKQKNPYRTYILTFTLYSKQLCEIIITCILMIGRLRHGYSIRAYKVRKIRTGRSIYQTLLCIHSKPVIFHSSLLQPIRVELGDLWVLKKQGKILEKIMKTLNWVV